MKYYLDPEFEKGYREYRLKKYQGCKHFLVFNKTIDNNGRLDNCYVCIKCEINEIFKYFPYSEYDNLYMIDYLRETNGVLPGFRSKTDLNPYQVYDIYQKVIKLNPKISNRDFEKILKEKEKELYKSGISRSRSNMFYM
ncbi:MAG: hypothetical protein IKX00_02610 [Bacilli bacterium]|nr:hypothetical protein [Bacilli bacterium]